MVNINYLDSASTCDVEWWCWKLILHSVSPRDGRFISGVTINEKY